MKADTQRNPVGLFVAGVILGGIGGGIAGWLLGGHIAPLVSSVIQLLSKDTDSKHPHFEALQQ